MCTLDTGIRVSYGLFAWEGEKVLPCKFRGVWRHPPRKTFLEFRFSEVDFSAILICTLYIQLCITLVMQVCQ